MLSRLPTTPMVMAILPSSSPSSLIFLTSTSSSPSSIPFPLHLKPSTTPPTSTINRSLALRRKIKAISNQSNASSSPQGQQTVYNGVYGPWSVESEDVREVILYRSGLVTAAASFVIASSAAFLPENSALADIIRRNIDAFYVIGGGGLGLSLLLIHIYVTPIKRFLQALWLAGVCGSFGVYFGLARPHGQGLVEYVVDNPSSLWLVGPLFAALTGLVFKEGLCYGKLEAGILTIIIPGVLLGHLTGLMDDGTKLNLLAVWMALFVVFSARKFQQPIKDDIGDKSIFMFNALPEEEKKALLQNLEQQME